MARVHSHGEGGKAMPECGGIFVGRVSLSIHFYPRRAATAYTHTRVYVYVYVRARSQVYVALYTNRKSEAITRYGTDKAGLTYLAGSLKRIKYRARPLIQRAYYPRLELFLR